MAFQVFSRDGDATWGMRVGWVLDGRGFLCQKLHSVFRLSRDFRDPMPEPSLLFSVLSCSGSRGSSSSSTSVIRGLNSYLEIYIDGLPQMEKYTDGHRWLFRFLAATGTRHGE
jgi:NADH:ubiquinone oxidoreductase subunit B-like Fe-S oxidoreductase